jgi:hypothetical protein
MLHCIESFILRLLPFAASTPKDAAQPASISWETIPAHPTEHAQVILGGVAGKEASAMVTPGAMNPPNFAKRQTAGTDFIGYISSGTGCKQNY